ncbi:FAD:protein FMN transferase [Polaribacter sp.]|nr:FAD:protein FMN transferase [Polaribacter sp.]MDA9363781.1 FAD:protein FMN transferase [Polaribacter sp.]MDB4202388.1 FAD:protein FMN transferase [Polaribacter sp.]MDB4209595.1 FAD:protein FMN transferase [Polaribacter sp.]MDC1354522.1 FAD:protein FMN transferase [Polaribacter sp.]
MKRFFLVPFLLAVLFACESKPKATNLILTGNVFGTTYKIVCQNTTVNYQKSIDSLFYLVNRSISTYLPSSDISLINKGDTSLVADAILLELLKKSKEIHIKTDGYFDPTVGNLVNAWGFGPKNEKRNLDTLEVQKQMKLVGFDKIQVVNQKVIKKDPGIYLDFNSIGKGFGIDVVARFLDQQQIANYMIEIGGEIRAKGVKKKDKPWRVQLQNPVITDVNDAFTIINLSNNSMATSGNYRKFRIAENGQKYVHTINPKTGFATESNLLSVSVIAAIDCADVDAYATAFMAMGVEKTKLFLEKHTEIKAILIYIDAQQNLASYSNYDDGL